MPKIAEVEVTTENLSMYPEAVQIRLNIEIGDTIEFWDIPELWGHETKLLLVNRKGKSLSSAMPSEADEWLKPNSARVMALKRELELQSHT